MFSSPLRNGNRATAEASSSRAEASRQPYAEDEDSEEETDLLGEDPLSGDVGAKYVLRITRIPCDEVHIAAVYRSSARAPNLRMRHPLSLSHASSNATRIRLHDLHRPNRLAISIYTQTVPLTADNGHEAVTHPLLSTPTGKTLQPRTGMPRAPADASDTTISLRSTGSSSMPKSGSGCACSRVRRRALWARSGSLRITVRYGLCL